MDDRWESEVIEYGAINITGFRIVDATRPYVKDFLAGWHRLDPATSQGAGRESISVRIVLVISLRLFRITHTIWKLTIQTRTSLFLRIIIFPLHCVIRSSEKFLSFYREIMDAQHFPFYIIL